MSNVIFGAVKWFSNERGYGFVFEEGMEDEEFFVHYSSVEVEGFKTLTAGQKVSFTLKDTEKGVQAVNVKPV